MTDKRQNHTKVKIKANKSTVIIYEIYSSLEELYKICCSSLTEELKTLPHERPGDT